MVSKKARVLVAASLIVFFATCFTSHFCFAETATDQAAQKIDGNRVEDVDYAFQMTRPSEGWQFLLEEQARKINADASLGFFNAKLKAYTVVIVEKLENVTLDEYETIIIQNMQSLKPVEIGREQFQLDSHPATAITIAAQVEGVKLKYRFLIAKRGNFFYQVIGWSIATEFFKAEPELKQLGNSLQFAADREPQIRATSTLQNDYGVNWKIADEVYYNGSFGMRLDGSENLRLAGRQELQNMAEDAMAGLVGTKLRFYQTYILERLSDENQEELKKNIINFVIKDLDLIGISPEVTQLQVGGMQATERVYPNAKFGGLDMDMAITTFNRDAQFYRIQSWWPTSERELGKNLLRESYQQFGWLNDDQIAQLEKELVAKDVNNAVGEDYRLRQGLFEDYRYGYSFRFPEGLWIATTGDTLKASFPDARIAGELTSSGVYFQIIPEILDMTHEQYHQVLRDGFEESASSKIKKIQQGDLEIWVSSLQMMSNGLPFTYRLVTAVRGQKHLQLMAWAFQANDNQLEELVADLIQGIKLPVSSPKAIESEGRSIKDHRLGYQVKFPLGWQVSPQDIPEMKAWASMALGAKGNKACVGMGLCTPHAVDENLIIEGMIRNSGITVEEGSRRLDQSSLAGLPANRVSLRGTRGGLEMYMSAWIAHRGKTVYLFLMVSDEEINSNEKEYTSYFSFLE